MCEYALGRWVLPWSAARILQPAPESFGCIESFVAFESCCCMRNLGWIRILGWIARCTDLHGPPALPPQIRGLVAGVEDAEAVEVALAVESLVP